MTRACVLLAEGFEEIEAVTVIDVLRRAAVETRSAGLRRLDVTGSHGITLRADLPLEAAAREVWDLIVLPGGLPGATRLGDSEEVLHLLRSQVTSGRRVAAICAAPVVLARAGLLDGRAATCYPSFRGELGTADYREDAVVVDGLITTSRGPGTAIAFALALVAQLQGEAKAEDLRGAMLVV